ncbi:hypothetical protein [Cumulibacter manganitolerans]|uniref:hypothetical protein n=1 Tax=Cumulibacter manganitolerans TaxID=1884992 RepID=UPI0012969D36|nr:hypothetical protein [Cumulibacter manganitolerans]
MRRSFVLALATLPLAFAALSACSEDSSTDASQKPAVADGVIKQYEVLADEVAEKGQTVKSGPWTVHLITEAAEPWHEVPSGGASKFREPAAGETNHIEIIPVETSTGRVIPDVPITLEVLDAQGAAIQKLDLNFYYSTFFHYASNFSIAEPGTYTVRATLGVPAFNRHGEAAEQPPLSQGATVEFTNVHLGPEK